MFQGLVENLTVMLQVSLRITFQIGLGDLVIPLILLIPLIGYSFDTHYIFNILTELEILDYLDTKDISHVELHTC